MQGETVYLGVTLLMLVFILKITGIPPTEAQALKSRGDVYREYQQTPSPFVPWPPRSMSSKNNEGPE